ncbi:MAG: alpha/beta hydrolase [Proteobacteria bacterium]|nr:alpha/beta hydrolase [Pseudomonadota bacterium]
MSDVQIRRGFVDVDEGQIHYRACGPASNPVLVMVHGSPGGSRALAPLMEVLGESFQIYAPDTLGNADSSPATTGKVDIPYLAGGLLRALDGLGLGEVFLWGSHTGGNIALEASIAQPQRIKKLVLDGVGLYPDDEREGLVRNHAPAITPDGEGSQFNWAWHFVRDGHLFWPWWRREGERAREVGLPDPDELHDQVMDVLKSIRTYHHSYRAALGYEKRSRLPLITVPTLVAAGDSDMLRQYTEEAAALIPGAVTAHTKDPKTPDGLRAAAETYTTFLLG